MKITYIQHSSFLVETGHVNFLFDYYEGEIPQTDPGTDLFVFVSHRHEDHFSPAIFGLAAAYPKVRFVLSDDIWENRVPEDLYGKVFFMGPDEEEDFTSGCGSVRVRTYPSTDEGVAFLIDADGKRLYHAGDLNYWYWEEEGRSWNDGQKNAYLKTLDRIAEAVKQDGHIPDAAFVPVDSRLGTHYYLGLDDFMGRVGAAAVFPMHTFDDGAVIGKMKTHERAKKYAGKILGTGKSGEKFEV